MDMQLGILAMMPDTALVVKNVAKAVDMAHEKGIPVFFLVVGFRTGAPEISQTSSKSFAEIKPYLETADMTDFMRLHEELTLRENDLIITKRRISAFSGSDLEIILRAYGIGHLVLTGITTSGVVLSTLREAADKDFRLTVLADACADRDDEVHQILTTKVFPGQATVIPVDNWL